MKRAAVLLVGPDRGRIGGIETHLNLLLGSPLAREFDLRHFEVGSVRGESLLAMARRWATSPFRLAAAIASSGARIVHVNTSLRAKPYWRDLTYVAAAKLCGAQVVFQMHGGTLREFGAATLMRRVLRATLRWADVIVVIVRSELDAMRDLLPRQNVALLPNAIDCRLYLGERRASPRPRAPLTLLYMGRLMRAKGLLETVQGLALALAQGVAARLVVAGDGPDLQPLRQAVRELRLEREVFFAGPAHGERKLKLFAEADVFLLPTYHREGLPYALLEAMAAGVVPIVTRVAAIPDVVAEGIHGLFVPPRDPEAIAQALAALAADRARLARMSAACRERVSACYSIERLVDDFAALYRKLERRSWAPSQAG
jgi:glycosyltransferase involved in cell wall biosynthesis